MPRTHDSFARRCQCKAFDLLLSDDDHIMPNNIHDTETMIGIGVLLGKGWLTPITLTGSSLRLTKQGQLILEKYHKALNAALDNDAYRKGD